MFQFQRKGANARTVEALGNAEGGFEGLVDGSGERPEAGAQLKQAGWVATKRDELKVTNGP